MSADMGKAWAFVLSNEDTTPPSGKVVSEPNGAMARLGINSHWHPEALGDGFYTMPLEQALLYAQKLFQYDYWNMILGYQIGSQVIASKWSDLCFNASPKESTTIVQRAANAVWPAQPITVDGIAGAWTMARVNMIIAEIEEEFYDAIIAQGKTFYGELLAKHPDKFSPELEAEWLKRLRIRPPD